MAEINISQNEEILHFQMQEVVIINKKEDDELYIRRVDFISDDELYKGEALPSSAESASVWRIRHIVIASDGDVTTNFANGNSEFINAWTDRASLPYS